MDFYEVPGVAEDLRQGDILAAVPFLGFSLSQAYVLKPGDDRPQKCDLTNDPELPDQSRMVAAASTFPAVVVNQSCDLAPGRERPILLARIVKAHGHIKGLNDEAEVKSRVERIKELANPGKKPTYLYLPSFECDNFSLPRSVVDLLKLVSLPPGDLDACRALRRVRLTQTPLQALQERFAYCFGRLGLPEEVFFDNQEREYFRSRKIK